MVLFETAGEIHLSTKSGRSSITLSSVSSWKLCPNQEFPAAFCCSTVSPIMRIKSRKADGRRGVELSLWNNNSSLSTCSVCRVYDKHPELKYQRLSNFRLAFT